METVIVSKTETDRIASFLLDNQIVCLPTETVFGLAVVADDYASYLRLIECKNRPFNKAFPLLIDRYSHLVTYAKVNARALRIINRFLPGPLTLILPKQEAVAAYVTAGQDQIAIRWSDDPFILELMQKVNKPLFLTSANLADEPPCLSEQEAYRVFGTKVACIVAGEPKSKVATTIVDLTKSQMQLVRAGGVELKTIQESGGKFMKIVVGSDHGGFVIKEAIKAYLESVADYEVVDIGTHNCDAVNYSNFGIAAGELVASKKVDFGIVVCGSGIGISIAANKVEGIRCALVSSEQAASLSRLHNDANMMALGGRFIREDQAVAWTKIFLKTAFEGGRHQKRIDAIHAYEQKK